MLSWIGPASLLNKRLFVLLHDVIIHFTSVWTFFPWERRLSRNKTRPDALCSAVARQCLLYTTVEVTAVEPSFRTRFHASMQRALAESVC